MAIKEVSFVTPLHTASKRDYLARMNAEKPSCMRIAKEFGYEYWDGDRKYGYGGYRYDGRWKPVAEAMVKYYCLDRDDNILDIGCGKGFLLSEFENIIPSYKSSLISSSRNGCDISEYSIENAPESVKPFLSNKNIAFPLHYHDKNFDFTYSINVFHNLCYQDLKLAIKEMVRVSKDKRYICVESYRNEEELTNLQAWQLTCLSYYTPDDWKSILEDNGYAGDLECIFFS